MLGFGRLLIFYHDHPRAFSDRIPPINSLPPINGEMFSLTPSSTCRILLKSLTSILSLSLSLGHFSTLCINLDAQIETQRVEASVKAGKDQHGDRLTGSRLQSLPPSHRLTRISCLAPTRFLSISIAISNRRQRLLDDYGTSPDFLPRIHPRFLWRSRLDRLRSSGSTTFTIKDVNTEIKIINWINRRLIFLPLFLSPEKNSRMTTLALKATRSRLYYMIFI